jgi:hypothetical protein
MLRGRWLLRTKLATALFLWPRGKPRGLIFFRAFDVMLRCLVKAGRAGDCDTRPALLRPTWRVSDGPIRGPLPPGWSHAVQRAQRRRSFKAGATASAARRTLIELSRGFVLVRPLCDAATFGSGRRERRLFAVSNARSLRPRRSGLAPAIRPVARHSDSGHFWRLPTVRNLMRLPSRLLGRG